MIAVVTGASAGVGRAVAEALGGEGWSVGLLARGRDGLRGAVKAVEAAGGAGHAISVDVADADAVERAADEIETTLGPIDVWVNNAMTTVFGEAKDISAAEFRRVTEVTYLGQVHGTLSALRVMRPRDRGTIVNVGSALAFRAIPLQAPYCAAKFAVRGFTESVRTELLAAGSGIAVTQVHLPAVNTPQFGWCRSKLDGHPQPVPPIYQPEEAAATILEAIRTPRRQYTLGSWNRMIVEGNKVMPGVLDHFAARTGRGSQVTEDFERGPDDDLFTPLDDEPGTDRGAHGVFDDRAGGVADPKFLAGLPKTLATLLTSVAARAAEATSTLGRSSPRPPH